MVFWIFYIMIILVVLVIKGLWDVFSNGLNVVLIIIILNGCLNLVIYVIRD